MCDVIILSFLLCSSTGLPPLQMFILKKKRRNYLPAIFQITFFAWQCFMIDIKYIVVIA